MASILVSNWEAALVVTAWVYGVCTMLFVLITSCNLLSKPSSELFRKFPDLAVAIAIIIGLGPQLATILVLDSITHLLQ